MDDNITLYIFKELNCRISYNNLYRVISINDLRMPGKEDVINNLGNILDFFVTKFRGNINDQYIVVRNADKRYSGFYYKDNELTCLISDQEDRNTVIRLLKRQKMEFYVFDSLIRQFFLKYYKAININYLEEEFIGYVKPIYNWLFGGKPLNSIHHQKLAEYFRPVVNLDDKSLWKKLKTDTVKVLTMDDLKSGFRDLPVNTIGLDMFPKKKWEGCDLVYFLPDINKKRSYCLLNRYKNHVRFSDIPISV